jgi:hypothetical protein
MKGLNMQLIDDRVFVPKRVVDDFTRLLRHLLTVGAQPAPRNDRLKAKAATLPWPLAINCRSCPPQAGRSYFFTSDAWLAMHCHLPLRSIQVSVK